MRLGVCRGLLGTVDPLIGMGCIDHCGPGDCCRKRVELFSGLHANGLCV